MSNTIAQHLSEGPAGRGALSVGPLRAGRRRGTAGAQLGRLAGESMEFMDHREYQPGDDLRRLDWSAYARSDKMIVKLFRQEVCPHLDLVVDGSRSIGVAWQRESPGGRRPGRSASAPPPPTPGTPSARSSPTKVAGRSSAARNRRPSGKVFRSTRRKARPRRSARSPPTWRPQGIRAIVSDLLWLGDPLELLLGLSDRARGGLCPCKCWRPRTSSRPYTATPGWSIARTDGTRKIYLDATALARYRTNMRRHCENWRLAARQVGAVFVPLVAERLCENWDFSPLVEAEILAV